MTTGHTALDPGNGAEPLEEVLVSARRRVEPLQATPLSVVALTAEELEARAVTSLGGLQIHVPNLTFAPSQNVGDAAANVFIRGIGQEDFIVGSEPGVAVYVDGIYVARALGTLMQVLDVERIEVLRGPQGTLFGRNAIGGAVQVVSAQPSSSPEWRASVALGDLGHRDFRAMVNAPLGDRLAVRGAVSFVRQDGYLHRSPVAGYEDIGGDLRPEGNVHSGTGRLQLRWLATDIVTADLSMDASRRRTRQGATHIDDINPNAGVLPTVNRLIREGEIRGPLVTSDLAPASLFASFANDAGYVEQDIRGISAAMTRKAERNTLRTTAAYRSLESRISTELDGAPLDIFTNTWDDRQHQWSIELQWDLDTDSARYTMGLFAFAERANSRPVPGLALGEVLYTCGCFYTAPPATAGSSRRQYSTDSLAAYAQAEYAISERVTATAGLRFTHDDKAIDADIVALDASLQPTDLVIASGANRNQWQAATWRAGLQFQATADLMLFASLARGYKSGGFNARPTPTLPNLGLAAFDPETADTLEVGLRSDWLQDHLRFNATGFYTSYRDMQLREQTVIAGFPTTLIGNAARSRIVGLELELAASPLEGLNAGVSYGFIDAEYVDIGTAAGFTLSSRFQRTPRQSWSASIDYSMHLAAGSLTLHSDYGYRSREQFQLSTSPFDQAGYGLLGARVTFASHDNAWRVALYGTNLTDERYRTAGRFNAIDQVGFAISSVGLPRRIGVQVTVQR